ncbi:hypothetical protein C6T69_22365 [Burkholderia multivorans]|uniref:acyltransferase family protein n=1 Tax=Burkholderia multivorans TaxID=87883 RepID=UPI000CFFB64C|nr:acyltransferase [Burkholderia multivorans]MBU9564157.1 acyltransferase [Burkholderia multivorans]PRG64638.1 hypothetical protein C6T69_22365 [Burkholderia multivorans]
MKTGNISYQPRLDLLRFFAAFLVVMLHLYGTAATQQQRENPVFTLLIEHGHVGVSLFLVMSGYLMCAIHDRNPSIKYSDFIYNRMVRVGPLAVCLFLLSLFVFWGKVDVTKQIINFVTLQFNADPAWQVAPLWTVAVEFQLYLIAPFLFGILQHRGIYGMLGLLGAFAVVRFMMISATHDAGVFSYDAAYYSIFGRLDQFALGMIAYMSAKHRFGWLRNPIHIMLALALLVGLFFFSSSFDWNADTVIADLVRTFYLTVEAFICAYLMIAVCNTAIRIPGERWLAWLGMTSYSIYLWHQLVIEAYFHRASTFSATLNPIAFLLQAIFIVMPLVALVSVISYRYIEVPILALRRHYKSKSKECASDLAA